MPKLSIIAAAFLLVSASGYKIMAGSLGPELFISSQKPSEGPGQQELEGLNRDIKQKLFALHSYQVIAQRNLTRFDSSLQELEINDIYKTYTYLNLTAARSQIQKVESEIKDLYDSHPELVEQKVTEASEMSSVHQLSFSMLNKKLKLSTNLVTATAQEIEKEYQRLFLTREFQVFEKNIEHLAHLNKGKSKKSFRIPAAIADNGELWESSTHSKTEFPTLPIDTLDWLAQSSDKITARTTRIRHHLSRRK